MVNVRVRGIYATAISKILINEGFKIIEASDKIRERLNVGFNTAPCDVTIKNTENPDEILVIGSPDEARVIFNVLVEKLKYVFKWESKIELNSVYLALIAEKRGDYCIADLGEAKGVLYPCKEDVGGKVIVGVKHSPIKPGDKLILTRNFRVVGKYVHIIHGEQKISFSEHIHGEDAKAKLSAIAISKLMGSGLGVHFRSSAKYADKESLISEIEQLTEEYKRILQLARDASKPVKLRSGEFIAIVSLSSLAKQILDEHRRAVAFTLSRHHSLKSMGLSNLVDFAESVLSGVNATIGENLEKGVLNYLAERLREIGKVEILHVKPTGEILRLQSGRVLDVKVHDNKLIAVLERVIKSPGIYDGLGIEKKPGDLDYVVVDTSKPILQHNYFRDGNWLGTYININTPPEISESSIKYHDLLIDIVIFPTKEVKVVDTEEIKKLHEDSIITDELFEYAQQTVQQILLNPDNYIFNPLKNHRN
ncbi:MAG: DUF402 domain-containing protein [Desulfurococcaceae archaeon]